MNRKTITVESKPLREGQKSRSFSVELLAYILANDLWELGSGGKERSHRPVFMAYAGTDQVSCAFSANLRGGRRVAVKRDIRVRAAIEAQVMPMVPGPLFFESLRRRWWLPAGPPGGTSELSGGQVSGDAGAVKGSAAGRPGGLP